MPENFYKNNAFCEFDLNENLCIPKHARFKFLKFQKLKLSKCWYTYILMKIFTRITHRFSHRFSCVVLPPNLPEFVHSYSTIPFSLKFVRFLFYNKPCNLTMPNFRDVHGRRC